MASTRIAGKDGFKRPDTLLLEEVDEGVSLLVSTPPAGLKLDWFGVDELIKTLVEYRGRMSGSSGE